MSISYVTGSCFVNHGCGIGFKRFRARESDENMCVYCGHDVSAHEILGIIQDGKFMPLVVAEIIFLLHFHLVTNTVNMSMNLTTIYKPLDQLRQPTNSTYDIKDKKIHPVFAVRTGFREFEDGVAVYGIPGIHGLRYTSTACYTGHR